MKEVKAYIRASKAEEVVGALEQIGIVDVTLIDVMGLGALLDPERTKYSARLVGKYSEVAKVETVCRDADVERVVEAIQRAAYTGLPGDGAIFVSAVEDAVKIRTGERGEQALG